MTKPHPLPFDKWVLNYQTLMAGSISSLQARELQLLWENGESPMAAYRLMKKAGEHDVKIFKGKPANILPQQAGCDWPRYTVVIIAKIPDSHKDFLQVGDHALTVGAEIRKGRQVYYVILHPEEDGNTPEVITIDKKYLLKGDDFTRWAEQVENLCHEEGRSRMDLGYLKGQFLVGTPPTEVAKWLNAANFGGILELEDLNEFPIHEKCPCTRGEVVVKVKTDAGLSNQAPNGARGRVLGSDWAEQLQKCYYAVQFETDPLHNIRMVPENMLQFLNKGK